MCASYLRRHTYTKTHTHHSHTNVHFFILKCHIYHDAHGSVSHGIILIILILFFFLCLILNILALSSSLQALYSAMFNMLLTMSITLGLIWNCVHLSALLFHRGQHSNNTGKLFSTSFNKLSIVLMFYLSCAS